MQSAVPEKVVFAGVFSWKTNVIESWGNNFRNIFQVSEQCKYIIVYLFMSGQK